MTPPIYIFNFFSSREYEKQNVNARKRQKKVQKGKFSHEPYSKTFFCTENKKGKGEGK